MAVDAGQALGKRERNKIANRAAILDAGLAVFSDIGFEASSISDVVKASHLSVGTFYNYFGDKESVFAELIGEILEDAREALNEARHEAQSMEAFVSGAFKAYTGVLTQDPLKLLLITKNTSAFRQYIFTDGQMQGIFEDLERDMTDAIKAGLMPPFPVRLMTAAMVGAGAEVIAMDATNNPEEVAVKAEFLGRLFLGGIEKFAQH